MSKPDVDSFTCSNGLDLEVKGEIQPALVEEGRVESPTVNMAVTLRGGGPVQSAAVGDALELHFSVLGRESDRQIDIHIPSLYIHLRIASNTGPKINACLTNRACQGCSR